MPKDMRGYGDNPGGEGEELAADVLEAIKDKDAEALAAALAEFVHYCMDEESGEVEIKIGG